MRGIPDAKEVSKCIVIAVRDFQKEHPRIYSRHRDFFDRVVRNAMLIAHKPKRGN